MPLSMRAAGGSYGFGLRPMAGTLFTSRAHAYGTRSVFHPSVKNGSFALSTDMATLTVFGADGNSVGVATAASLIDGASQSFVALFLYFSVADSCLYCMVKNAANEHRLVKATFTGTVSTPGAKFSPVNPTAWQSAMFCYESGNDLVIRCATGAVLLKHRLVKATGQIAEQNTSLATTAALAGNYVSADGAIGFTSITTPTGGVGADEGWLLINGLSINGTAIPQLRLSNMEVFGAFFNGQGTVYPVLAGEYVTFLPANNSSVALALPLVTRAEFDRWLSDICNKFRYV